MTGPTTTAEPVRRLHADMTPEWQRFQQSIVIPSSSSSSSNKTKSNTTSNEKLHPYQRQYSHVYQQRLSALKQKCHESFEEGNDTSKRDNIKQVSRILELQEDEMSLVVGTIVVCDNTNSQDSENEELVLEDESGRVTLLSPPQFWWCTGMVVAIQGCILSDRVGMFRVDEQYLPKMTLPSKLSSIETNDEAVPQVLLLSGLQLGSSSVSSLPRDMLLSYIQGHLDQGTSSRQIARVIICGESCSHENTLEAMKELDLFIGQLLASGVPVDVMPGANDPTTANWPQRPLHSSLFKYSSTFTSPSFYRTPNPYMSTLQVDNGDDATTTSKIQILGTDGTNMKDLVSRHKQAQQKQKKEQEEKKKEEDTMEVDDKEEDTQMTELQALCHTLDCHHVCPTGPDTVPTVPHEYEDPMVMTSSPHLYFGGNALGGFDTCWYQDSIRVVCVPQFATTGQVCLVNLNATLDCEIVQFDDSDV